MLKKSIITVIVSMMITVLSACGGSEGSLSSAVEPSNVENPTVLTITATNFAFDQAEYRVKAGEPIQFAIHNEQGMHAYKIEGLGINISNGQSKQYIIHEPGEYAIVCSIVCGSGHSAMKSTLIVE